VQWIEDTISDRVASARDELDELRLDEPVRTALANMAAVCTERAE
jgi:geranylgeranyl diphosphate synthase, type I